MALLLQSQSHFVVCAHRDVIITNQSTKNTTKITIPPYINVPRENNGKNGGNHQEDADDQESDPESKTTKSLIVSNDIHVAAISQCGALLAVTTLNDKILYILRINGQDDTATIISKREIFRITSGLRFSPDSKMVLLADKTGGCFQFDVDDKSADKRGKWLLGHLSIVLDILMTPNQRFIVTSDRDEKIRITRFPNTHVIESYCLGHSEYVSAVELLPNDDTTLISISGDKTLRLWNYITGEEIERLELPAAGYKIAINKTNQLAIVLLSSPISIGFYNISNDGSSPTLKSLGQQELNSNIKQVSCILFDNHGHLLVSAIDDKDELCVRAFAADNLCQFTETTTDLNYFLTKHLNSNKIENIEDLSILFKKKFDNLKDYHEKKKRRIEEKGQTN